MTPQALQQHIATLDAEIVAFELAAKRTGRTRREREACELLQAARGKLAEEVEAYKQVETPQP